MNSCKTFNIQRHYERNHKQKFAQITGTSRQRRFDELKNQLESQQRALKRALTEVEMVTLASYKIALILSQKRKPFSDGELVKECVLAFISLLASDFKQKETILHRIRQMQLSRRSVQRRTEEMAFEIATTLKNQLASCEAVSFALDESTDIGDISQLCIWIRFIDEEFCVHEELLSVKALHDRTQGKDVYEMLKSVCREFGLQHDKIVGVTTDGAPSMVGRVSGLAGLLSADCPELLFFHCIIHQEALCAKISDDRLSQVMSDVVKVVNCIRARSALTHRQFKEFLSEIDAAYSDLILHADVRWLSRGKVLNRFLSLLPYIREFLVEKKLTNYPWFSSLTETDWIRDLAFLSDITAHLNQLNLTLQGKDIPLGQVTTSVRAFMNKLEFWAEQLCNGQLSHFHMLETVVKEQPEIEPNLQQYSNWIKVLDENFHKRFRDFDNITTALKFFSNPFSFPVKEVPALAKQFRVNVTSFEEQLLELQALEHTDPNNVDWRDITHPALRLCASKIHSLFGSTYLCEESFSAMKWIKSKARNRLTDINLEAEMRCTLSSIEPDLQSLVCRKDQLQPSH